MQGCRRVFLVITTLLLSSCFLLSQAPTSQLAGDVADPSGAVVRGADVTLTDLATNISQTTKSNSAGHYVFPSVQPGTYKLAVTKSGFRQFVVPSLTVSIGKNISQNVKLEVGEVSQTVEVQATGAELQTLDASVGNVLNTNALQSLPSLSRDATALLMLQPMAAPSYNEAPGTGEGNVTSGSVAGARSDQNTFNLDGGDATSNTEGDNNYVSGEGTPQAVVPTPVESLEEFRVATNNSNAFARSSGAQVQLVTRRGTNAWHGAAYEYNQNTDYNANFWQLNHTTPTTPRGVWQDNRFGGKLGGPIWKDRAFFFIMYEGRRFKKVQPYTRLVPSPLMRQGILQFHNGSGGISMYNFATGAPTAMCTIGACDPRGLGMNPDIAAIWNKYEPQGNNFTEGDTLNTIGYDTSVPLTDHENDGIARFDFKINNNWDLMASGRVPETDAVQAAQVDIGGIVSGDRLGQAVATRRAPLQPRYYVIGLTGRITPMLTNDFHVNYLRHYWAWSPVAPFPQLPGLGAALQIGAESATNALVPLNVDTQNARARAWDGKDVNFTDNLSWVKGAHLFQFGGTARHQHFFHYRDDKVVSGLAIPEYHTYFSSTYMKVNTLGYIPPDCATTSSPNCILSTDVSDWNNMYATLLGMVSKGAQMLTRNGSLGPNAPGTFLTQDTGVNWYDAYLMDTWRIRPTLTLTYGLDWGVQTPPYEYGGKQTIMQYTNGQAVTIENYLGEKALQAAQGQIFNPMVQFAPIRTTGQKYPYKTDWNNFAPRLSLAWNPAFDESTLMGRMFGNQKTVFRMGYGRYFDRLNGVGLVMTPALGIGFGDLSLCKSPQMPTTPGAPAPCNAGKTNPTDAFRIGTDGNSLNIPSLPTLTPPIVPGVNSPYEGIDFRIDPDRKVGVEDTWTASIQRQLSNSTILEIGYVGRLGHHLYNAYDLNQVPYMFKLNGQTFAQAYDNAQIQSNFGANPAAVTPQPFFDALGGTAAVMAGEAGNFQIGDVTTIWDDIASGSYGTPIGTGSTLPLDQQYTIQQISSSTGNSNYEAGYASLRKQMSHGLLLQLNYTWSHSLDDLGFNQEYVFISPADQYNPHKDYNSSFFDRRHVVTGFFVYDLPFGQNHFVNPHGFLGKIVDGWQVSSTYTFSTGLPNPMFGASCDELGDGYGGNCSFMTPLSTAHYGSKAHYMSDGTVQAFSNPTTIEQNFRLPLFSDAKTGGGDVVRGFNRWNMDASLSKTTKITERVSFGLQLQAVNVFNHMEFQDAGGGFLNIFTTPSQFGLVSSQYNSPRYLNIGARIDF